MSTSPAPRASDPSDSCSSAGPHAGPAFRPAAGGDTHDRIRSLGLPAPDLTALRRLGLGATLVAQALPLRPVLPSPGEAQAPRLARVVEVRRDRVLVHDGRAVEAARAWPALAARLEVEHDALVVGDWTWLWRPGDDPRAAGDGLAWIMSRVPPGGRLSRRDAAGAVQRLVDHVDTALLLVAGDRDPRVARLDRLLVMAHAAGVEPVVVLTRADRLGDPCEAVDRVRAHLGGRCPVLAVDARSPRAAVALAPWLREGRTLALLGASGAGKSTLAATLLGEAGDGPDAPSMSGATGATGAIATLRPVAGEVRAQDGRGRHTTTARTLHPLPSGACLVDTPGLRQLALDVDAEEVGAAFQDIAELSAACRFRDCAHAGEPGCAVVAGVPAGRLASFRKLLREARRESQDRLEREQERKAWRRRAKAGRQRALDKRGAG